MVSDAQLLEAFESVPAEDLIGRLRAVVAVQDDCEQQASFQQRVQPWMMDCFGEAIARDAAFIGANSNRFASASRDTRKAVAVYTLIMAFSA